MADCHIKKLDTQSVCPATKCALFLDINAAESIPSIALDLS